jgi:hypothetical protein
MQRNDHRATTRGLHAQTISTDMALQAIRAIPKKPYATLGCLIFVLASTMATRVHAAGHFTSNYKDTAPSVENRKADMHLGEGHRVREGAGLVRNAEGRKKKCGGGHTEGMVRWELREIVDSTFYLIFFISSQSL